MLVWTLEARQVFSLSKPTFFGFLTSLQVRKSSKVICQGTGQCLQFKFSWAGESHFAGSSNQVDVTVAFPSSPSCHIMLQILEKDGSTMQDPMWASIVTHVTCFSWDCVQGHKVVAQWCYNASCLNSCVSVWKATALCPCFSESFFLFVTFNRIQHFSCIFCAKLPSGQINLKK